MFFDSASWEDLISFDAGGDDCKSCPHLQDCKNGKTCPCGEIHDGARLEDVYPFLFKGRENK